MHPCSSQVIEESVLPPVCEKLQDDVFTPSPSAQPGRASLTTVTAPLATDTTLWTTDTALDTNSRPNDPQGQKRAVSLSSTSYSQEHRAVVPGPSNYHKPPNRPFTMTSSEEDELPPRPRRHRSSDTDYLREHRATAADRHRYPKRHFVVSLPSWVGTRYSKGNTEGRSIAKA